MLWTRQPASENYLGMKVKVLGIAKLTYEEQLAMSLWQGLILEARIVTVGWERGIFLLTCY